ncbi:hypothetical protein GKQ38_05210 [Candidatus Nanohaloarchaea archaeon]|nr:hypothetical protein GKQ38_05210 [Candidatus Nanohaloarchaea archaeon]
MNSRKGFDISLTIIIAFLIVIVLVATLGAITNSYTGKFLNFGNNATNTSLVKSVGLIGGALLERSN